MKHLGYYNRHYTRKGRPVVRGRILDLPVAAAAAAALASDRRPQLQLSGLLFPVTAILCAKRCVGIHPSTVLCAAVSWSTYGMDVDLSHEI